jgi:hypothetical protein
MNDIFGIDRVPALINFDRRKQSRHAAPEQATTGLWHLLPR